MGNVYKAFPFPFSTGKRNKYMNIGFGREA